MSKIYLLSTFFLAFSLTACGQKGALYLPEKNTSEMPTTSTDTPNNPNITQDKKNDY